MPQFLTVGQVAERLLVKPTTVAKWIRSGRLEAQKPGRDWRITEDAIAAFLKASEVAS